MQVEFLCINYFNMVGFYNNKVNQKATVKKSDCVHAFYLEHCTHDDIK